MTGVSLDSASSLLGPDSASARRPIGSTMAPCSLLSAVAHLSTGSAGLPRPSGSALVCHRPSCASGLHSSSCASSLRLVRLLHLFCSSSVLCRSGSTAALWIPASASVASAICSAWALRILPIALALRLSTSGSSTTCSAAIGRPPGVVSHSSSMAPPTVGSTVGRCYGCGLGPAVSSLAPPSFVTSLDFVCRLPPGCPSSSWASSLVPTPPHVVSTVRGRTFQEGTICHMSGLSVLCLALCQFLFFLFWLCSCSRCLIISWFPAPVCPSLNAFLACALLPIWIIKDSRFVNSPRSFP